MDHITIDEIVAFAATFEKLAKGKWKKLPKGWNSKSRRSFYNSMGKGSVSKCIKKMKGNIDDPGAFCASLKDREKGTMSWRGGIKKKKKQ